MSQALVNFFMQAGDAGAAGEGLAEVVTHGVEGVGDLVTGVVAQGGQAVVGVVGVAEAVAIGQGDLKQLAGSIVLVAGGQAAGALAEQAVTEVVAECGGGPVGVNHGLRIAAAGVVAEMGDLA